MNSIIMKHFTIYTLLWLAGVSFANVAVAEQRQMELVVTQGKPLLPSFKPLFDKPRVANQKSSNIIFSEEKKSLRKGFHKILANFGLVVPVNEIHLSINCENEGINCEEIVDEVIWIFPKDYYFPITKLPASADSKITVIARHSFPIEAEIKLHAVAESIQTKTYTAWIEL